MNTPILDFLREYNEKKTLRFHMPGHKGKSVLGFESWDITEVSGADSLYEANGIIAESERNVTALFDSGRSFFSTEGSSQCIRAMLHLLLQNRPEATSKTILAARNAHKAFVYAAALLDFDIVWLWPEKSSSLCSCPITPEMLDEALNSMDVPPAAVYITSPDYLGHMADIGGLARVCHSHGSRLAVDNAHGAYLHFLDKPCHPLDLGADICCDSAHKTLPVLTGGAYLHLSRDMAECFGDRVKSALALFGSTSPSYLSLASLDACNRYLAGDYRERLRSFAAKLEKLKNALRDKGWCLEQSDPLRLTLRGFEGMSGKELYSWLSSRAFEAEYADNDFIVFMFTPENSDDELMALYEALSALKPAKAREPLLRLPVPIQRCSVREAMMAESELLKLEDSLGRICALPMVSCPPAIPVLISGEEISRDAVELLLYYGADLIEIVKNKNI